MGLFSRKPRRRGKLLLYIVIFLVVAYFIGDTLEGYKIQGQGLDESLDDGSWAIYWYLCGSDLESDGGCATIDLEEMMAVDLPENVRFVIETGGAAQWQNNTVDPNYIQRYVYDSDGFYLVDQQPAANMGAANTLASFLSFAKNNYPADKIAVIFWNHGGGSVSGAAFDELYEYDSLTLTEMKQAFSSVWTPNEKNPPVELIGFDTCLMATVDVADTFKNFAHYMVASEETEPGTGWMYTGWTQALAETPGMKGSLLGKAICDSFYDSCEEDGTSDDITLSLVDLTLTDKLMKAYEAFGYAALEKACSDSGFLSEFERIAYQSENYGGNTKDQGYTNMVDLGHLARLSLDTLPSGQKVLDALDEMVLYRVGGGYRTEATGLSCYNSYNSDYEDYLGYVENGSSQAFKYFFGYMITGQLDESALSHLSKVKSIKDVPEVPTLDKTDWSGIKPIIGEDGYSYIDLGAEADNILSNISFELYYLDEESDMMLLMGSDNDIVADWDNGVFTENFRNVWGSIDGNIVYMELTYQGDDYNLYSVPVLLNGEDYNLLVSYTYDTEKWEIRGARQGIDENGMASKELRPLQEGDVITTLWYISSLDDDSDFEAYEIDTFTVTAQTSFGEADLGDGLFGLVFVLEDVSGNTVYSDILFIESSNGEISTFTIDD